jgi:hypothetical protein
MASALCGCLPNCRQRRRLERRQPLATDKGKKARPADGRCGHKRSSCVSLASPRFIEIYPTSLGVVPDWTYQSPVLSNRSLTLSGGYGAPIGRFGLILDNLLAAEVVFADGRVVVATHGNEEELGFARRRRQFWCGHQPRAIVCMICPASARATSRSNGISSGPSHSRGF